MQNNFGAKITKKLGEAEEKIRQFGSVYRILTTSTFF